MLATLRILTLQTKKRKDLSSSFSIHGVPSLDKVMGKAGFTRLSLNFERKWTAEQTYARARIQSG
jgi:hypothetical protein